MQVLHLSRIATREPLAKEPELGEARRRRNPTEIEPQLSRLLLHIRGGHNLIISSRPEVQRARRARCEVRCVLD